MTHFTFYASYDNCLHVLSLAGYPFECANLITTSEHREKWYCVKISLCVSVGLVGFSRVPDFYSTFVEKSTLLDFKSGKYDCDSTSHRRSDSYPKPYFEVIPAS